MSYRSGFVTLLGRPNVGKSTLVNGLVGQKIAITSHKPQTTRNCIQAILTLDEAQIIFLDTPGMHAPKNRLSEYMVKIAHQSLSDVDLILWLVQPGDFFGSGDAYIVEQLRNINIPVFLVVNKIDTVKKEELYSFIDDFRQRMDFAEIIPISALKNKNTDKLISCVIDYLPEGQPYFDEDMITDQPERQLIAEFIREKAIYALKDEIPHGIAVVIESMKKRGKNVERKTLSTTDYKSANSGKGYIFDINATIICERDSHKRIVIGKSGENLKKIGTGARFEIERMLGRKVNLQLWVKVKSDWRDSEYLLKDFGYRPYFHE
ncbi:MAG: GTPase Era [Lachnospiraceae bacterium]|nr:GTPase Era [Lachnospiraceae bacterium]